MTLVSTAKSYLGSEKHHYAGSQAQAVSPKPNMSLFDNAVFGSPTPTPSLQPGKMPQLNSEHSLLSPGSSPEQYPQQQLQPQVFCWQHGGVCATRPQVVLFAVGALHWKDALYTQMQLDVVHGISHLVNAPGSRCEH